MPNEFPSIWFDTFLSPENAAPVDRELEFIRRHIPLEEFPRLLDVPCGIGRHAGPLASVGYRVLGVDRSAAALDVARSRYPEVEFRRLDMFDLGALAAGGFDALLCLWQSFGYGESEENRSLLAEMGNRLRPGGRLLIDVYNAEAIESLPEWNTEVRSGRTVRTKRTREGRRLRVELEYSDSDVRDVHEWEVYTPAELEAIGAEAGLETRSRCAWFDPGVPPDPEHMRMQLLFEKAR